MSKELIQCPFCGVGMRIESNRDWHRLIGDHDEKCVFMDRETMTVPARDDQLAVMIEDWNRRATPPAAQVQGEQPMECSCPKIGEQWDPVKHGKDCPVHEPGVAQLQGELGDFEAWVRQRCGMPRHVPVNWEAPFTLDTWAAWNARAALSAPPAAGVPWAMGLLNTGDWRLTRIRPNEAMTDEFNRRHSWEVERQMPPYSRERGLRSWFGETPEQAFTEAINDLFPGRLSEFLLAAHTPPASEQQQAVSVYTQLSEQAKRRTSLENVADVLAALNLHPQPAAPSQGGEV